jgi:hypothetical protein
MQQQGRWRRAITLSLLGASLASSFGCLSMVHRIDPAKLEMHEPGPDVGACARDHIHVFFRNGLNVAGLANLTGLRDYVQGLGYCHTYYGELCARPDFAGEIRKIHACDPEARFVLVGFSFGANLMRNLAQSVRDDGITIDLLFYMGANTLRNVPSDQPDNVCRIVNVLANGCIWNGDSMERAENIHVDGVWHFGSPTHQLTLEALTRELAAVAATVSAGQSPASGAHGRRDAAAGVPLPPKKASTSAGGTP